MIQWEKLLRSLGFTDSEAKIYLTSLASGPASVQDLAKKARVSRVTTYAVIETLTGRGLMSSIEKGKKKMFVAESPERLVSFVHNQVKTMETTLREIESSLQDLKLLQRGEKPVVRLYEGPEALKVIRDDMLENRPDSIEEFGNLDEVRRVYNYQTLRIDELNKLNIPRRLIFLAKEQKLRASSPEEEIIGLPHTFDFPGDVSVYGNKIALSTFRGKQISVLIESEDLAKTMRAMFDFVWHCLAQPGTVKRVTTEEKPPAEPTKQ
ncbi:MAG: helix-turn-helix domain-containing protein [bacterium]|nr:helix-turn-helix domain-containing protein [bacterium]